MGNKKRFLVDSNIIIGAEKGNRYCRRTLLAAGSFRFLVTKEVAKELGVDSVSSHVQQILAVDTRVQPSRGRSGFNSAAMKAYLEKEFGGSGGARKEMSKADKSLIDAYARDSTIIGIISNDKRDMEHGLYNLKNLGRPPRVFTSKEFAKEYLSRNASSRGK